MAFRVDHNTRDFIELITGDLKNGAGVEYFGPIQLIEYTVGNFTMIKSEDGKNGNLEHTIIDKTEFTGKYDFHFRISLFGYENQDHLATKVRKPITKYVPHHHLSTVDHLLNSLLQIFVLRHPYYGGSNRYEMFCNFGKWKKKLNIFSLLQIDTL